MFKLLKIFVDGPEILGQLSDPDKTKTGAEHCKQYDFMLVSLFPKMLSEKQLFVEHSCRFVLRVAPNKRTSRRASSYQVGCFLIISIIVVVYLVSVDTKHEQLMWPYIFSC